jgi:hypothetical protein
MLPILQQQPWGLLRPVSSLRAWQLQVAVLQAVVVVLAAMAAGWQQACLQRQRNIPSGPPWGAMELQWLLLTRQMQLQPIWRQLLQHTVAAPGGFRAEQ